MVLEGNAVHIFQQHPGNSSVVLQGGLQQPEHMPHKAGALHASDNVVVDTVRPVDGRSQQVVLGFLSLYLEMPLHQFKTTAALDRYVMFESLVI